MLTKYKNSFFQYGTNLLALLIFWGGMLRKSFNSDTVFHMVVEDADILTRIREGRYIAALGDAVLLKFGLRTTTSISITILTTFILLGLTMLVIQDLFAKWEPEGEWEQAGFRIGLDLVFLNVLFAENLMFGESSVYFAVAWLAAAVSVRCYARRKYPATFVMCLVAVCAYQYAAVFAAVLMAFYICMDENMHLSSRAVLREAGAVAICMGAGVVNLLSIWLLEWSDIIPSFSKHAGIGDIGEKLSALMDSLIRLHRDGGGILPNLWVPLLFALGIWILIILGSFKRRDFSTLSFPVIVYVGSNLVLYVIPLMQEEFSFPPRMSFCFYLIQGMLLACAYSMCAKRLWKALTWCGGLYLTVHLLFADFIVTNHFVSNTLDRVYINMMYEEMLKYERETGITVEKLAVIDDAYAPDQYEEVAYAVDQINERSLGTATYSLLLVETGRRFERVEVPGDVYDSCFAGKDWDYFDLEEQLVIEGDTAYWCIF